MTDKITKQNAIKNRNDHCETTPYSHLQEKIHNRETIKLINETKEILDRLIQYSIKNPTISISTDLLGKVIPLLRKDSAEFSDDDEIALWSSYNELTQLIKPATNFSLVIANQLNEEISDSDEKKRTTLDFFKFWKKSHTPVSNAVEQCHKELRTIFLYLISTVLLYVLIQGYCGLLSDALARTEEYQTQWITQYKTYHEKGTVPEKTDGDRTGIQYRTYQLAASVHFLADLTNPLFSLSSRAARKQYCVNLMQDAENVDNIENIQKIGLCISFQKQYSLSVLGFFGNYILPLVLGVLGATAFIVRNTLEKLETNSYLPSPQGKLSMRLCLGGVLGVISGIFISSGQEHLLGFNLNLIMISLVMGYSVEVAFSLFDSVVERMRDWTKSLKKQ
jgi:hypothetical protein